MEVRNRAHLLLAQQAGPTSEFDLAGDLLLLVSSWESRCTEILNAARLEFETGAVLRFAETGLTGRRTIHDDALTAALGRTCAEIADLPPLSVFDYEHWKEALQSLLLSAFGRKGAPIRIVIDASCCPKFYLLFIIGMAIKSGLAAEVVVHYAEGKYASPNEGDSIENYAFTEGNWRAILVPYLEGCLSLEERSRLIVTTGFETFQARKFIQAYESDHHELIVAYPGFLPEYDALASAESEALISHLAVTDAHIVRFHAGDAIGVAEHVLSLLETTQFDDVALCLGTKPHALGLALASLIDDRLTVICRRPDEYIETDVTAIGQAWLYRILDKSSLVAPGVTAAGAVLEAV